MGLFHTVKSVISSNMKRPAKDKTSAKSRIVTIHLQKKIRKIQFKKRAPRAIREIRKYASKQMGTSDVRIDSDLNKHLWSRGITRVPGRVRVRLDRLRADDEDGNKMYTLVSHVRVPSFKKLKAENVEPVAE